MKCGVSGAWAERGCLSLPGGNQPGLQDSMRLVDLGANRVPLAHSRTMKKPSAETRASALGGLVVLPRQRSNGRATVTGRSAAAFSEPPGVGAFLCALSSSAGECHVYTSEGPARRFRRQTAHRLPPRVARRCGLTLETADKLADFFGMRLTRPKRIAAKRK
jgi:hypothetical protein